MKIINANIPADLSRCAIEEGLNKLKPKRIYRNVVLLASSSYNFRYIYGLRLNEENHIMEIPFKNIDTSEVLERDSWMLIDYEGKKIYYNEGV